MARPSKDAARAHAVCAFAESAEGPGWANAPVWVVMRDGNGKLSMECLQPEEQNRELVLLYPISQAVHLRMVRAATDTMNKKKG